MQKRVKKGELFLNLLILILVIGISVCLYQIIAPLVEYRTGDNAYLEIAQSAQQVAPAPEPNQAAPEPAPAVRQIYFDRLTAINPDTIGWICSAGTVIDYPVVRGSDNEYYLTHLFSGEKNKLGALFADYRNAPDFSDKNTLIYGHHMKNGSMFASLVEYRQQAYYETHPTMLLYTPAGNFTVEVFGGYITSGLITEEDEGAFQRTFDTDKAFLDFVKNAKLKSDFTTGVEVSAGDRILTLITCTYEYSDARYVVHGRLTPIE